MAPSVAVVDVVHAYEFPDHKLKFKQEAQGIFLLLFKFPVHKNSKIYFFFLTKFSKIKARNFIKILQTNTYQDKKLLNSSLKSLNQLYQR